MEYVSTEALSSPSSSSGSRTPKSGATTPRSATTAKRLSVFRNRRKSQIEFDATSQLEVTDVLRKYSSHSGSSSASSNMLSPREDLFFEPSETVKPFPDGANQKTIILQGCAEVGKSLLVKQLLFFEKGIEETDDATTIINNPTWRDEIRREMIETISRLAIEAEAQNLTIEEPYNLLGKEQNIRTLQTDILDSTVNPNIFFDTCYFLWNDPSVKEVRERREKNQSDVFIPTNISFYFKDKETIEKISQFSYAPSVFDYVQCYTETTSVSVIETSIQSHKYKFIDSCGKDRQQLDRAMDQLLRFQSHQKNRKSILAQSFEMNPDYLSISAANSQFWFVASLTDYDEPSTQKEYKNKLIESLEAWETSLSIWLQFSQRPVMLILSKYDLLREKWSKGYRFEAATLAKQLFGSNATENMLRSNVFFYDDAVEFIAQLYLKKLQLLCQQWKEDRFIRVCVVDTTDRRTVAKLFTEVAEKFNFSSEMVHLDNHVINFVKMVNRDSMKSKLVVPQSPTSDVEEAEEKEEEETVVIVETMDQFALFEAFQNQGPEYPKPIFRDTYDPVQAAQIRKEIKANNQQNVRPPIPHIKSRSSGVYVTPPELPPRTVSVPILPLKDLQREPTSPTLGKSNSEIIIISPTSNNNNSSTQQEPTNSARRRSVFSQFKNLVNKVKDSTKSKVGPAPPPPPSKNIKPKLSPTIQGQEYPLSPKQEDFFKDVAESINTHYTFVSSSNTTTTSLCSSIQIKMTYELSLCNIVFKLDDGSTWKYDKNSNQSLVLSPHSSNHTIGATSSIVPTSSPSFFISTPRDWSKETNLKLIIQMDTAGKLSKLKLVHNTGTVDEDNFVFRMKRSAMDVLEDWLTQRRRKNEGAAGAIRLDDFLNFEDSSEKFSLVCCLKNYELGTKL